MVSQVTYEGLLRLVSWFPQQVKIQDLANMEYSEGQEESDSSVASASDTGQVKGSDSGFESDIRMRTKSLEATSTRRGHSVLVVSGFSSPVISSTRSFSHCETVTESDYEVQPETPTKFDNKVHDKPRRISITKDAELHQKGSGHAVMIPSSAYSIQAGDDNFFTDTSTNINQCECNGPSETDYLLESSVRKKINRGRCSTSCCVVVTVLVIGILSVLGLSLALLVASIDPGPIDAEIYVENEDTVLLDFFDTFYYKEIQIKKSQDNQCPDCTVEVYAFYPDNLIVADNYFNTSSSILTATHDGVLLAPKYYVSGSKITMHIKFYPTKGQNSSADIVLFNDLHQYEAYRRGDKTNPHQVYPIQVNEIEKSFSLVSKIASTGYYFIGIRPKDAPITFQSSFQIHQICYSRGDFPPPKCVLDTTDSCTIPFTMSSTDDYTDTLKTCVLVYSAPPQEVAKSYYVSLDYDVYRGFLTTRSQVLLSLIGVLSVGVCFLSVCWTIFCFCMCLRKKAKKVVDHYS